MIDELERDAQTLLVVRGPSPRLVERVAVDHHQKVVSKVAREEHAAAAYLDGVERVLRDDTHSEKIDRFGERSNPVPAHVGRCQDGRGGWCVAGQLRALRGAGDDRFREQACQLARIVGPDGGDRQRRQRAQGQRSGNSTGARVRSSPHVLVSGGGPTPTSSSHENHMVSPRFGHIREKVSRRGRHARAVRRTGSSHVH